MPLGWIDLYSNVPLGYLQNYGNQSTLVNSVGTAYGSFAGVSGINPAAQQRYSPERANAEEKKSINALADLISKISLVF